VVFGQVVKAVREIWEREVNSSTSASIKKLANEMRDKFENELGEAIKKYKEMSKDEEFAGECLVKRRGEKVKAVYFWDEKEGKYYAESFSNNEHTKEKELSKEEKVAMREVISTFSSAFLIFYL